MSGRKKKFETCADLMFNSDSDDSESWFKKKKSVVRSKVSSESTSDSDSDSSSDSESGSGSDSVDLPPEAGQAVCALAVGDGGSSTCKKQIGL